MHICSADLKTWHLTRGSSSRGLLSVVSAVIDISIKVFVITQWEEVVGLPSLILMIGAMSNFVCRFVNDAQPFYYFERGGVGEAAEVYA